MNRLSSRRTFTTHAMMAGGAAALAQALLSDSRSSAHASFVSPVASSMVDAPRGDLLIAATALPADTVRLAVMDSDAFNKGHIPLSRVVAWEDLEIKNTSEDALAAWQSLTRDLLTRVGVQEATQQVVTYDDGTLFAARLWWVLTYLGFATPLVVDGGLPAWIEADGEIERAIRTTVATQRVMDGIPATPVVPSSRPEVLATKDQVLAAIDDPDVIFVDTRNASEYAAGHIPGAVNLDYRQNAFEDAPHFWKSTDNLTALYAGIGVSPDLRIVPYCSTGVRSAVTYFTLQLLGFKNVALYSGSWAEWSSDPATPKQTGTTP